MKGSLLLVFVGLAIVGCIVAEDGGAPGGTGLDSSSKKTETGTGGEPAAEGSGKSPISPPKGGSGDKDDDKEKEEKKPALPASGKNEPQTGVKDPATSGSADVVADPNAKATDPTTASTAAPEETTTKSTASTALPFIACTLALANYVITH